MEFVQIMNRRLVVIGIVVLLLGGLSSLLWLPPLLESLAEVPGTATPEPTVTPTPTPTPPASIDVQIVVRDAETRSAVAGARVYVGDNVGQTDGEGVCTLEVPNQAFYLIRVQSARHLEAQHELSVSLVQDVPLTVEVELEPNSAAGQVLGYGEQPLVDAAVTIGDQRAALDAEARFVVARVAKGEAVSVSHPGYKPYDGVFDGAALMLRLEPITATFQVYDSLTGLAIAEASVCTGRTVCDQTDAAGSVVVHGVASRAALVAQRQGYFTTTVNHDGQGAVYSVELVPRQLTGFVRDVETGEPLTDTRILFNGQMVSVDQDGRYHLPDLTGADALLVKTPGYERVTIPIGPEAAVDGNDHLDVCQEPGGISCVEISLTPFAVRGIYVNFNLLMWNKARVLELIDLIDRSPTLNAIVVDIKSDRGFIALESDDPLVRSGNALSAPQFPLPELLSLCKEKGIYTIARMVVFKDNELIKARPELAVRHPDGEIFYDNEGMAWGDPTRQEVWDYNIAISLEAIRLGFDEIQYDYLRYPSDATSLEVVRALVYSIPYSLESRVAAVSGFVAAAQAAIAPTPAFLSADIFGFALSITPEHDMRIGQRLMDIAPLVDYVCPMIYPSTFIPGNLGLASPSDQPYEVIAISMAYGMARTDTIIRPWLQHYWYERHEIAEQRRAAEAANDAGWCYWNAGAKYDEVFFLTPTGDSP